LVKGGLRSIWHCLPANPHSKLATARFRGD
jgi:hypothetical protein